MSTIAHDFYTKRRLTVRDYHRMGEAGIFQEGDRLELIEGEIIDMTPVGSPHASTVTRLTRMLDRAVGEDALVSPQNPVILGEHSEPEPDIALLKPRDDFYASSHPAPKDVLLIIEVADSSLRYDREIKIPLYSRHAIPEVWLFDLEHNRLTIYFKPTKRGYEVTLNPETPNEIAPQLLPNIRLDLTFLN